MVVRMPRLVLPSAVNEEWEGDGIPDSSGPRGGTSLAARGRHAIAWSGTAASIITIKSRCLG